MKRFPHGLALLCLLVLGGCASVPAARPANNIVLSLDASGNQVVDVDEKTVLDAVKMIEAGRIMLAVDGPLAQVVKKYELQYADKPVKVFCAEGMVDALVYAAMVDKKAGKGVERVDVIGPAWAKAYWARGYAYDEMARYDDARVELEKAIALSPMNAQYRSELAFVYLRKGDWNKSLALYREAFGDAEISAAGQPAALKSLQCEALRGEGYALVELHRLDDAVTAYRGCLKLQPGEPKSLGELGYIKGLRATSH